ncbi:MAG: paraquat-inducible protein A [Desulfobacterales bacterium]|jgi:paraquat-inducible protein A
MQPLTAKAAGLVLCHDCRKLLRWEPAPAGGRAVCPRCGAAVHRRRYDSIGLSWALTFAALIFLVPANLFPIMTVVYLGEGDPSTIIDGVLLLFQHGMIPIGLIIFIASIAVPFLKITGIVVLLLSVQFRWRIDARQRTLLYRMVEWIGRWSMLDIFVIAILAKLVEMGRIATIEGGVAAAYFGMAVILTMLAAQVFDERLIWDVHDTERTA